MTRQKEISQKRIAGAFRPCNRYIKGLRLILSASPRTGRRYATGRRPVHPSAAWASRRSLVTSPRSQASSSPHSSTRRKRISPRRRSRSAAHRCRRERLSPHHIPRRSRRAAGTPRTTSCGPSPSPIVTRSESYMPAGRVTAPYSRGGIGLARELHGYAAALRGALSRREDLRQRAGDDLLCLGGVLRALYQRREALEHAVPHAQLL